MSFRSATLALVAPMIAVAAPLAVVAVPAAAYAQAARDASAEAFVQREAQRALQILQGGETTAAKKAEFRSFVDQVADVPRITAFVLGKYRRTATPAQYQEFAQAFRQYANGVYESRLGQYSGQGLKVTGSIVKSPGDVIVSSVITGDRTGKTNNVDWRVLKGSDGRWRVVDVEVEGVWLAITQQQDFVSTLDNSRGDISALSRQLRSQAAQQSTSR